jgi:hypothetical protein
VTNRVNGVNGVNYAWRTGLWKTCCVVGIEASCPMLLERARRVSLVAKGACSRPMKSDLGLQWGVRVNQPSSTLVSPGRQADSPQ